MNKIVKGFMFLSLGTLLFSQNILTNPSFENDLDGWNIYPSDLTNIGNINVSKLFIEEVIAPFEFK